MVNIPRSVKDDFYRYKMPELVTKVEGRGNGIKTVLVNISDIGKTLARPPVYFTKYAEIMLGTLTFTDTEKDRYVVNGTPSKDKLEQLLDEFIEKYVLCRICHNPETIMNISRRGAVKIRCKACGANSRCPVVDKMSRFIMKVWFLTHLFYHPLSREKRTHSLLCVFLESLLSAEG